MRGIILAGGKGSRLSPCTKVTNKHLLPVYSEAGAVPMLFYPINTLVKSGITDILVISSREHCGHIIENLSDGFQFHADFSYKIQDHNRVTLGIASALKLAENFTNGEPFAVILGDNFFEDSFEKEFEFFFHEQNKADASIFLKEVPDPHRFGVYAEGIIEEKPTEPKSNWAVTGLYLYTPHVYEVAETLKPSKRGELEITDINNYYCGLKGIGGRMQVNYIKGFWSDMGVPKSMQNTQEFIQKSGFKL
jgi:glucose-1-phosphate thymidylyltransferase